MTQTHAERIPTIILTGFLGAGKTTLLNRLIEHYNSERTVLLINEFGQVSIDGELLAEGNYEKIELNKGSLFCICVRTDFIFEVERIAKELKPELLIIEATGLADTSEMEKMLAEYEHPISKEVGEKAREVGGHGGMDFIMDYRLVYCLRNGLPLDQDVYDAAEWSAISEISEKSIEYSSMPIKIPDFTRGAYKKVDKVTYYTK